MAEILKLGIIGMSEGNGHPYSWSAICNGYDVLSMKDCPFPSIPDYLGKQSWPQDKIEGVKVTHIWTQDTAISQHIAKSVFIDHAVLKLEDMIGKVDAVLLARDDAENHPAMALPFIKAGLPIFVDKPFALSRKDGEAMIDAQQWDTQLFTCSSLRFAKELHLTEQELEAVGEIQWVEASVPKKWDTYAVHILEPLIAQTKNRGALKQVFTSKHNEVHLSIIEWSNLQAYIKVTGNISVPITLTFYGKKSSVTKIFKDSFSCFKTSIEKFILQTQTREMVIDRTETMEITDIIEWGRR